MAGGGGGTKYELPVAPQRFVRNLLFAHFPTLANALWKSLLNADHHTIFPFRMGNSLRHSERRVSKPLLLAASPMGRIKSMSRNESSELGEHNLSERLPGEGMKIGGRFVVSRTN